MSCKLEEVEDEKYKLLRKIDDQEDMIATFFYNCKSILKQTDLLDKIQHVNSEYDFDCKRIAEEFYRHVELYPKSKFHTHLFGL